MASLNVPTLASELIETILAQFHDTHLRDWLPVVAMARELESRGARPALADDLEAMARSLERHMFKEEVRLFPLMQQGGHASIPQLVADMQAEHRVHAEAVADLEGRLASFSAPSGSEPRVAELRSTARRLFDELAQHMQLEDELLFPLFLRPSTSLARRTRSSSRLGAQTRAKTAVARGSAP